MPGLPSTTSEMESPTGWTKQLMSVACRLTPAAELMRPAGMKPSSCACRKRRSQAARRAQAHLLDRGFLALGVFFDQRVAADLLLSDRRDGAVHTGRLYSTVLGPR